MSKRPNVVLFISDQQRADTMPGEGGDSGYTPHLEWLAGRSATFRNAFCASPICTPARGSLLTGLFPHATGVVANYESKSPGLSLPPDAKVLADYLKLEGYACAYTGKWHLPTGDDRRGFDDFVYRHTHWDVSSEESDDTRRFARKLGVDIGSTYTAYLADERGDTPTGGGATRLPLAFHPSTLHAQQAAAFVRRQRDDPRPFALVYSCIEPHPLGTVYNISPCPFDRMYDPADMTLPASRRDPGAPAVVRRRNFKGLIPTDRFSDDDLRAMKAGYYGAVSYVDHLVGLILEALIETDQFDDTLFVFVSDHGEMLGDHRMLKKGPVMFEEMIRVPFLLKPPGPATDGREVRPFVSQVDLVPTVLGYCGVRGGEGLHGADLRPLIEGSADPLRDGVGVQYHSCTWGETPIPLRCWRGEEWKYVETIDGDDELYDLREDPGELRNLAEDPPAAGTRRRMRERLYEWLRSIDDPWPEIAMPEAVSPLPPGPWADLATGGA